MADAKLTNTLESWKTLLREGRVTEVDKQIEELRVETLRIEAEAAKKAPPPAPQSEAEVILALFDTLCDLHGNPPRVSALLTELHGYHEKRKK